MRRVLASHADMADASLLDTSSQRALGLCCVHGSCGTLNRVLFEVSAVYGCWFTLKARIAKAARHSALPRRLKREGLHPCKPLLSAGTLVLRFA